MKIGNTWCLNSGNRRYVRKACRFIMAKRPSNIERSDWGIDLLDIQPTDNVLEIGFVLDCHPQDECVDRQGDDLWN